MMWVVPLRRRLAAVVPYIIVLVVLTAGMLLAYVNSSDGRDWAFWLILTVPLAVPCLGEIYAIVVCSEGFDIHRDRDQFEWRGPGGAA